MIQNLFHFFCKTKGWKLNSQIPEGLKQAVIIGFPHTSNWDFLVTMFLIKELKLPAKFAIKKEWTKGAMGMLFRPIGAIGIDRDSNKKESATKSMANLFKQHDDLFLLISPEGTRSKKEMWKTGFYYIAAEANVPIIVMKANYKEKILYVSEKIIYPTDFEKDMKSLHEYCKDAVGYNNENMTLDLRFK